MAPDTKTWGTGMQTLGKDAYAWVQGLSPQNSTAGISNAGLILGLDGCLVIDTMNIPSMVRPFRQRIAEMTPLPIRHVVLTHVHGDHTHNLYLFPEAESIAHERCRSHLEEGGQQAIEDYAKTRPHWAEELKDVRVALPNVTITDRMTMFYGEHRIERSHPGPAHTDNDVIVYLPEQRVLYAGDIFFFWSAPLGHQGDFPNWLRTIDEVLEMDLDIIVPGHGPIGTKDDALVARGAVEAYLEEGRRCFQAGYSLEEAIQRADLGEYAGWPDAVQRIRQNFGSIYRSLGAK